MKNIKKIIVVLLMVLCLFMVACDEIHQHEYIDGECICGAEENKFVVMFDTNGGTSVSSVKVFTGKTIEKPADPQKEGYSFVAWMYQGKEWNFEEDVVTADVILEAEWKSEVEDRTLYKYEGIVYKLDTLNSIYSVFSNELTSLSEVEILSDVYGIPVTKIEAEAFAGCESLQTITIPNSIIEISEDAFLNCKAIENIYYQGSKEELKQLVLESEDFDINIFENVYVYNSLNEYEKVEGKIYLLNFYVYGKLVDSKYTYFDNESLFEYLPEKEGYKFIGWYYEDTLVDANTEIKENMNLEAKFEEDKKEEDEEQDINSYVYENIIYKRDSINLTYSVVGNNISSSTHVVILNEILGLPVTKIEAEAFAGCKNIASIVVPNSVKEIEENAFKDCDTIDSFIYQGTEDEIKLLIVKSPSFDINAFSNKYIYNESNTFERINGNVYSLMFYVDEELVDVKFTCFDEELLTYDASKVDKLFVGWYYEDTLVDANTEIKENMNLKAHYQEIFKLTLISIEGEIVSEIYVKYGEYISLTETYGDKSVYWEYCGDIYNSAITFEYLCDVELQMHISEYYTYNIFSNVAPINWSGLKEQTDSEKELYSYINDSLFAFDYKFDSEGNIIAGDYEVEYSAAKEVVDITSQYAGVENGWDIPYDAQNQVYKITLREDLRWDDGTCIKAEDFVYSMRELLNPLFNNQNAEKFYDGKVVIKNAYNYFHQGLSGMYAANNIYKEYSEDLDSELVFSVGNEQNGASYINSWASTQLGYSSPAPLSEIVYALNYYGAGLTEETVALMEGKTFAEIKADAALKAEWDKMITFWQTEPNEELHFFIVEYSYPEITDDKLGIFVGENEYEFIIVFDKPVVLFTEDGSLSYKVINDLPVLPLFKKDLYESCKIAPSFEGECWESNYGTSVETTASWGPYKLVSYEYNFSYTLEKNNNWYGYSLEENEALYQTTHIVCEVIYYQSQAINQFLAGKLDNVVLDTASASEYFGNNHAYYMMTDNVTLLNLQSNKEKLEARESEGINKTMLTYSDFRKALSLAINRVDFVESSKTVGTSALGLFNSMHYNDVENGSVYRNTDEAKQALCDVYGIDVSQYNSLDEAYAVLTGYDLEQARDLVRSAYEQALTDGEIDEDDVVELTFGTYIIDEIVTRRHNYIKEAWIELVKDTPLEGRLQFSEDAELNYAWADNFRVGEYDVVIGGWSGAAWDPGYLLLAYLSPDYMYSNAWDTSNTMMTFTMKGVGENGADITETMSLLEWYDCLNGNSGRYDWSSNALDESIRVQLIAALEKEVLESGYTIPLYSSGTLGLISDQIEFPTYEYNTFVKFGGVKYITYNYDDVAWGRNEQSIIK